MTYLSEDVVWSLPDSLQDVGGTKTGRDSLFEMMKVIFGAIYIPESVKVTIHQVVAEDDRVALRFHLAANSTFGTTYSNEYSLFANIRDGVIVRVWEYLDTLGAQQQFTPAQPSA